MNEKVVLIGAGSVSFTRGLLADMMRAGWGGELALVDAAEEAMRTAEGLARKMVAAWGSPLKVFAATDRRRALPDATSVICTIGVGGRRSWEQDVLIPRRYGIYQPVGDTVMPGGSSRALRMIPAMVAIARDVLELAPRALFINYANPMSAVCRAVRKATGAAVIGLCHGVPDTARELAEALGVPAGELQYSAVGINHLTWFVAVSAGGADLMPRLAAMARQKAAEIPKPEAFGHLGWGGDAATVKQEQPFSWRLMDTFGAYPAPGDRHVTEFFPPMFQGRGAYYGKTLGEDAYPLEAVIASGDRRYEQMRQLALSGDPLPPEYVGKGDGEHEQAVEIVESIRTGRLRTYSANLPNAGQAPNLPSGAVIEGPAVSGPGGLRPVMLPPLPSGVAGTLATRFAWVETIVEAALEASRAKFIQALLLDGAVTSVEMAGRLAADLLAAQRQYLPQFEGGA